MSTLYVTATPIGNLKDITFRAVEVLQNVDFVICEDTRVTGKLLNHLKIKKKMISLNAFTEKKSLVNLIDKILENSSVAFVSDAGTPGISDPGVRLVNLCRVRKIGVIPIPGPSALTASLSASGFDSSIFLFLGFLPKKKGRKRLLEKISNIQDTVVFYESPHRIKKTLIDFGGLLGDREIGIYKEITKIHEEFISGTIMEVLDFFEKNKDKIKGEFVVIINSK